MALIYKEVKALGRSMYLYYPDIQRHNPYLVSLCTVLRGDGEEASAQKLLDMGFRELAQRHRMILAFPNPAKEGWNADCDGALPDDLTAIEKLLFEVNKEDDEPLKTNWIGIPELSEMLRQWHPMFSMRYLVGLSGGENMALTYAACKPENVACVMALGGELSEEVLEKAARGPVSALLFGTGPKALSYFNSVCGCVGTTAMGEDIRSSNPLNPYSYVISGGARDLTPELVEFAWKEAFSVLRKINTGKAGDMNCLTDLTGAEFTWFVEDTRLDGTPHTWLVHVPGDLEEGEKVPLMVFYHGGSDNPTEAAHMAKLHELGRREHFITVYPWGTNTASWNINYDPSPEYPEGNEDELFGIALIDHMLREYPTDPERVYLSGFSNGAAMAQVIAMLYPEKIAGLMHIDSNWPGNRWKPMEVDINEVPAMRRALEGKSDSMRMPVWYTYGTREASCPAYKGCTQQHQYDFWKRFNNIEIRPTQEVGCEDPCPSGVPGEKVEVLYPDPRYPENHYTVNRFYTRDEGADNLYNYVLMQDKGHEVAPTDPILGWQYVKNYRRKTDGTLVKTGK